MNKVRILTALLFVLFTAGSAMAQREVIEIVSNVTINSINKMEVFDRVDGYYVTMWVSIVNKNDIALRLRNGEYDVYFSTDAPSVMNIGRTKMADQVLPGKGQPDGVEVPLTIKIGPKSESTLKKLFDVINVVGNPKTVRQFTIKGDSEVGVQVARGWTFEPNRRFEVELTFTPDIQRQILMK